MTLDEIRENLEEHRKDAMITCEESCPCWQIETLLSLIDRMGECLEGALRPVSSTSIIKANAILKEVGK